MGEKATDNQSTSHYTLAVFFDLSICQKKNGPISLKFENIQNQVWKKRNPCILKWEDDSKCNVYKPFDYEQNCKILCFTIQ